MQHQFDVIVIGGGHAGVEAAWAAANLLARPGSVALITLDPSKIGVMSCNPAIGGLAKGQIVREIDALGGLMGLATDATGIQFKVLNTSKGPAVHGPRAQCDKHAYAEAVQRMVASRPEITVIGGSVEELRISQGRITGVVIRGSGASGSLAGTTFELRASAVVLTTGTFMRGLMHTGEAKTEGGRFGEAAAVGISGALRELGFELGRLKTGTPPRLRKGSINWDGLPIAGGDAQPKPFSDLTGQAFHSAHPHTLEATPALARFPVLEQVECRITSTNAQVHDAIRANLHRAPMYSGQIESIGPRYCPSIEDKVVRFADRDTHHVYLEPESLRDDWIYCNGISTSLPADVQDVMVRAMPGCEKAEIYRYGYAVEYDMVKPHQIDATGMTKLVEGLFLAGQINGTSGYEEAGGQGVIAGINAALLSAGRSLMSLGREQAYIGVLMDDLVTKTPTEPYRMFTSRAEHRLLLRADNAADRLTPVAIQLGLLEQTDLGRMRKRLYEERISHLARIQTIVDTTRYEGVPLKDLLKRPDYPFEQFEAALGAAGESPSTGHACPMRAARFTVHTERFYQPFIDRQSIEIRRSAELEKRRIPHDFDYATVASMRSEARAALARFRPATLGQARRMEGITPADVTLLSVLIQRHVREQRDGASQSPFGA